MLYLIRRNDTINKQFNWLAIEGNVDYNIHYNKWLFVHDEVKVYMLLILLLCRILNKIKLEG